MAHRVYQPTLHALHEQLKRLDAERQQVLSAISAIEKLPEPAAAESSSGGAQFQGHPPTVKTTEQSPSYADAARAILSNHGKPMHMDEIVAEAKRRGWYSDKDFSDRNDRNSFLGGLDRNARKGRIFFKPEPATYGLLSWKTGEQETIEGLDNMT